MFDLRGGDHIVNEWDLHLGKDIPLDLDVELGAGQSDLALGGLRLTELDIRTGAGESTIDLSGDWERDLDVNIQGGVGKSTLRLPEDVGVRVRADVGLGDVDAHGLSKDGDAYVNDAYGESDITLDINLDGGVGEVNLELAQ